MSASCYRRKDFQKKVALPTATSFMPSDVLLSVKALTLVKDRGIFFNRLSRVAFRRVLVLCNGTMLVYENESKGWNLHVRQIETIKTKMTRKMSGQMRTQIDLKTNGGSLILVVDGAQTKLWLSVFSSGEMEEESVVEKPTDSLVSLFDEEGILAVEVAEDLKGRFGEEEKSVCSPLSIFEPKSNPPTYDAKTWEMSTISPSASGTTSESVDTESLRHGPQSVATLRNIIEAKARVSVRKMRKTTKSISGVPTVLMMAEEKQGEKEESEKKSRLPHLGKSISAPAVLNATKMKKLVHGLYDSCFDSYAGLIEQQNSTTSVDPTGRTDILAIIDAAQADGTLSWRFGEATASFQHRISLQKFSIEVTSTAGQVEIRVPLHLIGSVCYIHEQLRHLICISIAPNESSPQTRDIVLLLAPSKTEAESVCQALNTKFQQVFRDAATENICVKPRFRGSAGVSSSSHQQSPRFAGLPSGATTARSLLTSSEASTDDYIALLAVDLSDNELQALITLITTYQDGRLGLLEYLQKLKELYGPHRKHRLPNHIRYVNQEDQPAFLEYLRLHVGEGSDSPSVLIW